MVDMHLDTDCPQDIADNDKNLLLAIRGEEIRSLIPWSNNIGMDNLGGPILKYRGNRSMESLNAPNIRFRLGSVWDEEAFDMELEWLAGVEYVLKAQSRYRCLHLNRSIDLFSARASIHFFPVVTHYNIFCQHFCSSVSLITMYDTSGGASLGFFSLYVHCTRPQLVVRHSFRNPSPTSRALHYLSFFTYPDVCVCEESSPASIHADYSASCEKQRSVNRILDYLQ
jgi:hypothetical protein